MPAVPRPPPPGLFLAYGSLLEATGDAQVDAAMRRAEPLGRAWFAGELFDLGTYPGAVARPGAETKVWGELYRVRDPEAFYAVLDPYEGWFAADAQSEFVRRQVTAWPEAASPAAPAQCYLYNRDPAGRPRIPGGEWIRRPEPSGPSAARA